MHLRPDEIADLRELIRGIVDHAIREERERIAAMIAMMASHVEGPSRFILSALAERLREETAR